MPHILPHRTYFIDRKAIRTELGVGFLLLGLGLVGVVDPFFLGLNLNPTHALILNMAGLIAIWSATSKQFTRAFYMNTALGIFFAAMAITGPYLQVFNRTDHFAHFFFAIIFLTLSLTWKRFQKE